MYKVCPKCGIPSISVNHLTVQSNIKASTVEIHENDKWSTCVNPTCNTVYHSNKSIISIDEVINEPFYKNSNSDTLICYCSGLTRKEIHVAVSNGCKTISDVQKYTGKTTTGMCESKHPIGQCCSNSFMFEIKKALGNQPPQINLNTCSCCK